MILSARGCADSVRSVGELYLARHSETSRADKIYSIHDEISESRLGQLHAPDYALGIILAVPTRNTTLL